MRVVEGFAHSKAQVVSVPASYEDDKCQAPWVFIQLPFTQHSTGIGVVLSSVQRVVSSRAKRSLEIQGAG